MTVADRVDVPDVVEDDVDADAEVVGLENALAGTEVPTTRAAAKPSATIGANFVAIRLIRGLRAAAGLR